MESLHCDRYIVLLWYERNMYISALSVVSVSSAFFSQRYPIDIKFALQLCRGCHFSNWLNFPESVETSIIATWEMRVDAASKRRRGIPGIYRIATGLVCYWTIARDVRVICHQQIQMHFFSRMRKNGMSIGATGSRLEPMTGSWLVVTSSACTGVYTLLLRHVKV